MAASRCRATTTRWTSSGPSARRSERAPAYADAAGGKSGPVPAAAVQLDREIDDIADHLGHRP